MIYDAIHDFKIAVVIPAYKVAEHIRKVILSIPENIDHIIVVDDKCPNSSGREAEKIIGKNVTVICHTENQGVGGAVITGYKKALELGCDIVIKMDGDGQMDPKYLQNFINPLIRDKADYTKGNRFKHFRSLKKMPKVRLFGNSGLSFLAKAASGYWNIMDPTNGYTAIHMRVLEKLNLENIAKGYFFESDMLINLNLINAVVKDINIPAKYENAESSLNTHRALFHFPWKLLKGFIKRIFLKYYIYDFNMASIYMLLGIPMLLISSIFGIHDWLYSSKSGIPRTAGQIMLVALPIIISFQMLLQAIQIDINSVPKK
jgi:dolichol-phosphate mannosyltransferase